MKHENVKQKSENPKKLRKKIIKSDTPINFQNLVCTVSNWIVTQITLWVDASLNPNSSSNRIVKTL